MNRRRFKASFLWSKCSTFSGAIALLVVLCVVCHSVAAVPGAKAAVDTNGKIRLVEEHWYSVLIDGKRSGHMRRSLKRSNAKKLYISSHNTVISLSRAGQTIRMEMGSTFTETFDHKPVSAQSRQLMGKVQIDKTMVFLPDGIQLMTRQGDSRTSTELPNPKEKWLTPQRFDSLFKKQFVAGAKRFEAWTLDPLAGTKPIRTTLQVVGRKDIEVMGKKVQATELSQSDSAQPHLKVNVFVDAQGETLQMRVPMMPGLDMTIVRADRAVAISKVEPQELLLQTLVRVDNPIARPRQLRRGAYDLTLDRKGLDDAALKRMKDQLAAIGVQRVDWQGALRARVVVDLDKPVPVKSKPGKSYLAASSMLNCEDGNLIKLAAQALKGAEKKKLTKSQTAERLRAFVHRYVRSKNLGVALATASEVARTRQGDCTEHAVLLAALLRVKKIPSRVATGLIYADQFVGSKNVFGYHMWTQAWIKDRWIDLDPVLSKQAFDATHITLGTSAMGDDEGLVGMAESSMLINRIQIKVIEPKPAPGKPNRKIKHR